jgi:N-acetylmuramoyl-L-alanine amidase
MMPVTSSAARFNANLFNRSTPAAAAGVGPRATLTKPEVISAPSPNKDSRNGKDIDTIVLHHTGSNNGTGDLRHMRNASSKVSAHYMVDRDGKIYQLVKDGERAWHAGKSALHGVPTDVNGRSIGIEIVNDGGGRTPYTEAQYKALEKLVPWLAKTYSVPVKNLVGHKDVALPRGRKDDPSANFDFARIRRATERAV